MELLRVPLLNANEDEVLVADVSVREGAQVGAGDLVCMLESTKATLDVEAPVAGYVRRLSVRKGDRVKVGALICAFTRTAEEPLKLPAAEAAAPAERKVTRKARELAEKLGLDVDSLGLSGIIKEEDIRRLAAERGLAAAQPARSAGSWKLPAVAPGQTPIVLYGASGHARVLIDLVRLGRKDLAIVAAVDDDAAAPEEVLGVPVIGSSHDLPHIRKQGVEHAVLGIGLVASHQQRVKLYRKLLDLGFKLPNLVHPRAALEPSVSMGEGNQVFAGAVVGSAVRLGDNTIINSGTVLSHDCVIGSHTHVSPGAILAGGVSIGENTLVGMGVTIYLGVRIGSHVTIANGSHVLKDVPDHAVVRAHEPSH